MKDKKLKVKLLYWGWDQNYTLAVPKHQHPFWQIEIINQGLLSTTIDQEKVMLKDSAILIIPPENSHNFPLPHSSNSSVFSFKFDVVDCQEKLKTKLIAPCEFSEYVSQSLRFLLRDNTKKRLLSNDQQQAIEYMLENIIDYVFFRENTPVQQPTGLVREVYKLVNNQGKKVNVEYAAQVLNCSTSYLKRYIKAEKGIPAKKYIDQECLNLIIKHLSYSTLSLTQIAENMNFPDIYAFSRFFKRMTSMSPREYRKKQI